MKPAPPVTRTRIRERYLTWGNPWFAPRAPSSGLRSSRATLASRPACDALLRRVALAPDGGTRAVLELRVEVRKGLIRHLTPLLRPLFAWNHRCISPLQALQARTQAVAPMRELRRALLAAEHGVRGS